MIACVHSRAADVFVEPTIRDMASAGAVRGVRLAGVAIERLAAPARQPMDEATLLYVLPFATPARQSTDAANDEPDSCAGAAALLKDLFPNATVVNSLLAHELSTDRVLLGERLLERGIAVPETLVTASAEEARDFIQRYEHVVLRDVLVHGRSSGLVAFCDSNGTVIGEARGKRYVVELEEGGVDGRLRHGVLSLPPPFFVQRLITRVGRSGILLPAQVLRGYVVDEEIPFWTEAYRDRVRRPSDFLLSAEAGAPRRFVQVVSDEAAKLVRRVAKVVGGRITAVDIIRSDTGYVVLDVVTDGRHTMIDRSFKSLPEYRDAFNLDRHIVYALFDQAT